MKELQIRSKLFKSLFYHFQTRIFSFCSKTILNVKKILVFLTELNFTSFDTNISYVVENWCCGTNFPRRFFFSFSLNKLFSMRKMKICGRGDPKFTFEYTWELQFHEDCSNTKILSPMITHSPLPRHTSSSWFLHACVLLSEMKRTLNIWMFWMMNHPFKLFTSSPNCVYEMNMINYLKHSCLKNRLDDT